VRRWGAEEGGLQPARGFSPATRWTKGIPREIGKGDLGCPKKVDVIGHEYVGVQRAQAAGYGGIQVPFPKAGNARLPAPPYSGRPRA